jgi:hemoglobin/transferrin/lactoferrin receptor protein
MNYKCRAGLFLLFIIYIARLQAQTITVMDFKDFHPVPMAIIILDSQGESLISNEKGQVEISPNRIFTEIYISHWNYKSLKLTKDELDSAGYKIYLRAKSFGLDEIIVSANKKETKRSDLSIQSLAVNAGQIQFTNPSTTADLMQSTGEIQVQKSQQGGGSPVIRGFEANKILLVVDGVRMNNAIFRGGHLQNIITMDPSIINKAEVVFGPSSVIYGSDALGGVIHFHTKKPQLSLDSNKNIRANALVKYATANKEKTAQLDFNVGYKSFASFTALSVSEYGDLRQGNVRNPFYGDWGKRLFYVERIDGRDTMLSNGDGSLQRNSGYTQYNLMQKILWERNHSTTHLLNFQYSTTSNIPRYDRLTEVNTAGTLRHAEWYYGPQDRLLTSYVYTYKPFGIWFDKMIFNMAYQHVEESRHNRNFNNSKINHRIENVDIASIILRKLKRILYSMGWSIITTRYIQKLFASTL